MNRRRLIAFAMLAAIFCGDISCGGVTAGAAGKASAMTLYRKEARYLTIPGNPKKKALKKYQYASSRPKVVSVSKKGRIRAKKAGTATITMREKGRKKKVFRYRIRVVDYAGTISLTSASQVVLKIGGRSQIRAEVLPRTAGERRLIFSSRDGSVAQVSPTGEIVAVEEGITYIDVTSKGKKKNGKKIRKSILVYVDAEEAQASTPVIPSRSDTVIAIPGRTSGPGAQPPEETGRPGASQRPGETGQPGASQRPGESGQPGASQKPEQTGQPATPPAATEQPPVTDPPAQTLEQCIAAIQPPGPQTLQAASFVVSSQGRISTLYFLNKSYAGNVSLVIDGVLLQGAGSVDGLLAELQQEVGAVLKGPYYTSEGGSRRRVFRIGRKSSSEPWVIQNRRDNTVYSFYVMAVDTVYGTPYGLIVADGDTSARIAVQ